MQNSKAGYYLLIAAVTLVLSYLSVIEYIKVTAPIFPTWAAWHEVHMNNLSHAPYQYRLLSYAIPEFLISVFGLDAHVAYLTQRFVFLFLALFVFYLYMRRWFDDFMCLLAAVTFVLFYNLTALPHFQPSEEINIFVFALGTYAIREQKFFFLWAVVTIGAFNKSTPIFLVAFYFFYSVWPEKKFRFQSKIFLRTMLLAVSYFAVYFGLRYVLGTDRSYAADRLQLPYNLAGLMHSPMQFSLFLFPSILPALAILADWKHQPPFTRSFVPVILLFTAGHLLISRAEEFRTYMPLALVTFPAMLLLAERKLRRSQTPT